MVSVTAGEHADKYNDPRVKVTRTGVLLGVGVVVFAIVATTLSVTLRRTQLEKTTEYFGAKTILALQLGERIQMLSRSDLSLEPVELTGTPGLGHLRRALLDDRHYEWSTAVNEPVSDTCGAGKTGLVEPYCVQLLIQDPTLKRFDEVRLDLELNGGWVGVAESNRRVQVSERVQPALKHFLTTLKNVKQQSYDNRK
jgi:hypothetical protein